MAGQGFVVHGQTSNGTSNGRRVTVARQPHDVRSRRVIALALQEQLRTALVSAQYRCSEEGARADHQT